MNGKRGIAKRLAGAKGFSLIELLIVLVVIGLLAGIVLVNLLSALEKSRQRATMADMRTLAKSIESYQIDLGYFPANGTSMPGLSAVLVPYQANVIPQVDHWNHAYVYTSNGTTEYSIESYGKDGADGANINYANRYQWDQDLIISVGRFTACPDM
jgi:general secretion pathway protein G